MFYVTYRALQILYPKALKKLSQVTEYTNISKDKNGIEIGGPSQIFSKEGILPLYDHALNIDGCNFSSETVWEGSVKKGQNYKYASEKTGFQFISEASDLSEIKDEQYDFLISSHCLEHCANPIKTLKEWIRVVKMNGHLLIVIPHKNGTFDNKRPVTSLEHMIHDYNDNTGEDDLTHLEEILKLHDWSLDPYSGGIEKFKSRALKNLENRCLHQHVFNPTNLAELINYTGLKIKRVDFKLPFHIILLAQKVIH